MYIVCVCCCFQTEKCFCVKGDKCPSIGEANESAGQRSDKVCIFLFCMYIYVMFVFIMLG